MLIESSKIGEERLDFYAFLSPRLRRIIPIAIGIIVLKTVAGITTS